MLYRVTQNLSELLVEDNKLAGIVVPYNQKSQASILPNGVKVVKVMQSGCFGESLAEVLDGRRVIFCNVEHDFNAPNIIGSTDQNIELEDRPDGLYMSMTMPDIQSAKDLYTQIKLGFVQGLSVEYLIPEDYKGKIEKDSQGNYVKTIETNSGVIIDGFAITSHPRFLGATLVTMNDEQAVAEQKEIEEYEKSLEDSNETQGNNNETITLGEGNVNPSLDRAITELRIDALLYDIGT